MKALVRYLVHSCRLLLLLVTSALAQAADSTAPIPLKHNPFMVPAAYDASAVVHIEAVPDKEMSVRAVLFSPAGTLVNINGSIIGLHESVDGYELVFLDEEKAVLSRDGKQLVLDFPNTSNSVELNRHQHSRSRQ